MVIKAFPGRQPSPHRSRRLRCGPRPRGRADAGQRQARRLLGARGARRRLAAVLAGGLTPENVTETIHRVAHSASTSRRASSLAGNQGPEEGRRVHRGGACGRTVRPEEPDEPSTALSVTDARAERHGRFGEFGGTFVPRPSSGRCAELEVAFRDAWSNPSFRAEYLRVLAEFGGRPTPLTSCERLSGLVGGVRALEARGPLAHRLAQAEQRRRQGLLTKRMGKSRLIAETGAGQHGVATATAAASSASSARCSWARSTRVARPSTSFAWSSWAPRSSRSPRGAGP